MEIKGFIGYWGNRTYNLISESLAKVYKQYITDSLCTNGHNWMLITSKDFVKIAYDDGVILSQERNELPFNICNKVTINSSSLTIERDQWGIRTFYYLKVENGCYFSSDIRFLLSLPISSVKDYCLSSISEISSLGFILDEEKTLFAQINQVPRNSILKINQTNYKIQKKELSSKKIWFDTIEDSLEVFEKIFEHTVANVDLLPGKKAYLLSGGMDSTAIAIAASKNSAIDTISFSSNNNENDIFYAKKIANYLGCKHIIIDFNEDTGLLKLPNYFHDIEQIEPEGIFSPLGGYAYYLLCQSIKELEYSNIIPGEGADELLGGYYWPLTHPFGFVDKLKKITSNTSSYSKVVGLFPEIEEKKVYSKIAYNFLQGTALTNYHLNCVEHTAKSCGLFNYPVFLTGIFSDFVRTLPLEWLCDGTTTKIILRRYLHKYLDRIGLTNLIERKKMAMPSVITPKFSDIIHNLSKIVAKNSNNPYKSELLNSPINIFMFDLFHKYFTNQPLISVQTEEWKEDLNKINKNECVIHW